MAGGGAAAAVDFDDGPKTSFFCEDAQRPCYFRSSWCCYMYIIQFLLVDPSIHLLARVDVRLALEGRTIGHPITKPQNNGALVGDDM